MPPELDPLLTPPQVAETLAVSLRQVRELTARGVLVCVRLNGRVIRYRRADVERLIGGGSRDD